jgi:hypothetical protein
VARALKTKDANVWKCFNNLWGYERMNNCQDIFHALYSLIVKCRHKYIRRWNCLRDRDSKSILVWLILDWGKCVLFVFGSDGVLS